MAGGRITRRMRRDWDQRARENARYYVVTGQDRWSDEEFYQSGQTTLGEEILNDLGNICQGMDPKDMNVLEQVFFDPDSNRRGIVASILHAVERQTGMHENIFLTKKSDFEKARFSSIFKTNEILSKFLAPSTIVMGSALCHMTFVFGNKAFNGVVKRLHESIKQEKDVFSDLVKSLLMNTMLALGGIFLLPLTKKATRYAIEATKWSMYAATYSIIRERPSKNIQRRFFGRMGISPAFLDRWLQLSNNYSPDTRFTMQTLGNVMKIHALGFKIKKG